jgi:hypothetical protein
MAVRAAGVGGSLSAWFVQNNRRPESPRVSAVRRKIPGLHSWPRLFLRDGHDKDKDEDTSQRIRPWPAPPGGRPQRNRWGRCNTPRRAFPGIVQPGLDAHRIAVDAVDRNREGTDGLIHPADRRGRVARRLFDSSQDRVSAPRKPPVPRTSRMSYSLAVSRSMPVSGSAAPPRRTNRP